MRLWPEAYEALRAEAFAAAEQAYGAMPGDGVPPGVDPYEGILAARAGGDVLFPYRCPSASDRLIEGVRCRIIVPAREVSGVYLHFHGGGMAIGTPELNDDENEVLARELGLLTVSVDYRLAPEHPYPAAIEDALAVARWLVANSSAEFGTERLVVGGESAGAYLAAMTLLGLRDLGAIDRVLCANLVFGVFDWGRSPSQRGFRAQTGPDWLAPEAMAQFADFYLPGRTDEQRRDAAISPAFAELHDMPPALFTIGTLDHMFDDTIMTAARWSAAGNQAALAVYPDCGHGFHWFTDTELKRMAVQRIHDFLAENLSQS